MSYLGKVDQRTARPVGPLSLGNTIGAGIQEQQQEAAYYQGSMPYDDEVPSGGGTWGGSVQPASWNQSDTPTTHTLGANDTFWSLAAADLGSAASNSDIAYRAQQYMQVNGSINPLDLQQGEVIYVPNNNVSVSTDTISLYNDLNDPNTTVVYAPHRQLTTADYNNAATRLPGVDPLMLQAIGIQEARQNPYNSDGSVRILFEPHVFQRLTGGIYNLSDPQVSNSSYGGGTYSSQYGKLDIALGLNENDALESASYGQFQIMGFNYANAGYDSVGSFVAAMQASNVNQLDALVTLAGNNPALLTAMQQKDFAAIAYNYNGPNYQVNHYDTQLRNIYMQLVAANNRPI